MKVMDNPLQNTRNMQIISAASQTFCLGTQAMDYLGFLLALRTQCLIVVLHNERCTLVAFLFVVRLNSRLFPLEKKWG